MSRKRKLPLTGFGKAAYGLLFLGLGLAAFGVAGAVRHLSVASLKINSTQLTPDTQRVAQQTIQTTDQYYAPLVLIGIALGFIGGILAFVDRFVAHQRAYPKNPPMDPAELLRAALATSNNPAPVASPQPDSSSEVSTH